MGALTGTNASELMDSAPDSPKRSVSGSRVIHWKKKQYLLHLSASLLITSHEKILTFAIEC